MEYRNPNITPSITGKLSDIERQFIIMRAEGTSIRDIARKMKKSTHTICDMNKKFSKYIFNIRNAQFSELQREVIDLKRSRLNFLKGELEKVLKRLKENELSENKPPWEYNDSLSIFVRLSELMSACEYDMLSVGTNFKENLQPESNDLLENGLDIYDNSVAGVAENNNNVAENSEEKINDNNELTDGEQQIATNNNTQQQKNEN